MLARLNPPSAFRRFPCRGKVEDYPAASEDRLKVVRLERIHRKHREIPNIRISLMDDAILKILGEFREEVVSGSFRVRGLSY